MRPDMYSILALAARYWFCGLALVIVFRAWRITVIDNRRAKILRSLAPETSNIGELIILPGSRGKKPIHCLVPREGVLGSSSRADICIRHGDILKKHLFFEQCINGLLVRPLRNASVMVGETLTDEQVILHDGDTLTIGKVRLMLVLFDAAGQPVHETQTPVESENDDTEKAIEDFFDEDDVWPEK